MLRPVLVVALLAAACGDDDDDTPGAEGLYFEATITVVADPLVGSNTPSSNDDLVTTVSTVRVWFQDEEHWRSELRNEHLGPGGVVSTRRGDHVMLKSDDDSQDVPLDDENLDRPLLTLILGTSTLIGPTTHSDLDALVGDLSEFSGGTATVAEGRTLLGRATTSVTLEGASSVHNCRTLSDGSETCDPIPTDRFMRVAIEPDTVTILRYEVEDGGQSVIAEATTFEAGRGFDSDIFDAANPAP